MSFPNHCLNPCKLPVVVYWRSLKLLEREQSKRAPRSRYGHRAKTFKSEKERYHPVKVSKKKIKKINVVSVFYAGRASGLPCLEDSVRQPFPLAVPARQRARRHHPSPGHRQLGTAHLEITAAAHSPRVPTRDTLPTRR